MGKTLNLLPFLKREPTPNKETLKKVYRRVFGSDDGQVVLRDLITSIKLVQNAHTGQANVADVRAYMDGQRAFALQIITMLED